MKGPILVYPDPNKSYTFIMDVSKYAWLAVLTHEHTSIINGKIMKHQHPITYISGIY